MSQMLALLNQRQKGTLLSDTIVNLNNDGGNNNHCMAVTTQSYQVGDDVVAVDNSPHRA